MRRRFTDGSSVRVLHPQRWSAEVARLLAPLEQLLQCPLGCNAYLTPPGSQVRGPSCPVRAITSWGTPSPLTCSRH